MDEYEMIDGEESHNTSENANKYVTKNEIENTVNAMQKQNDTNTLRKSWK